MSHMFHLFQIHVNFASPVLLYVQSTYGKFFKTGINSIQN